MSTTPVVRVHEIKVIHSFGLYENSDDQPTTAQRRARGVSGPEWGNYAGWGRGPLIHSAEWLSGRERHRAAVLRNSSLSLRVTLEVAPVARAAITGTLEARARVDGDALGSAVNTSFTFAAGARHAVVVVAFGGRLPDEIGRVELRVAWSSTSTSYRFIDDETSQRLYLLYDQPVDPAHDSTSSADTGAGHRSSSETYSGTQQRLDHLMRMLGRSNRMTAADVNPILWRLHRGINDASPPFFDAGHAEKISDNGESADDPAVNASHEYAVTENWMMWAQTPRRPTYQSADGPRAMYWNDGSCIGHVQLLKTMVASIGMFARRAWVLPTTTRVPPVGRPSPGWMIAQPDGTRRLGLHWQLPAPSGRSVTVSDEHIHALGRLEFKQWWLFPHPEPHVGGGPEVLARPVLIEPGGHYGEFENFEACLRTPQGRFLPGGYSTESIRTAGATRGADRMGQQFVDQGGFVNAQDVLRWWANTGRDVGGGRFVRFVLWSAQVIVPRPNGPPARYQYYFDLEGVRVGRDVLGTLRAANRNLPVPGGDP